jgi:hypothetical protein
MPLMGFPRLSFPGYSKRTDTLGEQVVWQTFCWVFNRWRTQTLKLPPLSIQGYFDQPGTQRFPILNGYSEQIVPRPLDWIEHIHITGYWFPKDILWNPPKDLLEFLDTGKPPVFIGFGSMPIKNPRRTTEIVLGALKMTGQRGILHSGWSGLGDVPLPENVFKIDYVPYGWLFPRMAMIIHHGGSGTTRYGLRSGKPCCIVPLVFDQFYWGKRIAELGVGTVPIPFKKLTVGHLQQTIEIGIHGQQVRQNARDMGDRIRAENGVQVATHLIQDMALPKAQSSRT